MTFWTPHTPYLGRIVLAVQRISRQSMGVAVGVLVCLELGYESTSCRAYQGQAHPGDSLSRFTAVKGSRSQHVYLPHLAKLLSETQDEQQYL